MIKVGKLNGFTKKEEKKILNAVEEANRLLTDDLFKMEIAEHEFNGNPGFAGSADAPESVMKAITENDVTLDLHIKSYCWPYKRNEVAHSDGTGITFNRKFFTYQETPELVNTLIHELCHQVGYSHDYWDTAERPYSIPYAVGNMAEEFLD